ncbi:hypothetical protein N0V90_012763 [Kalmusia sp. IMI 367209]|nr:hypothetical protein N0V90_012763 [Kalmusia sp. IMI 367209]
MGLRRPSLLLALLAPLALAAPTPVPATKPSSTTITGFSWNCAGIKAAISIRPDLSYMDLTLSSQLTGPTWPYTECRATWKFDVHSATTGLVVDRINIKSNVDLPERSQGMILPSFNHGDDWIDHLEMCVVDN